MTRPAFASGGPPPRTWLIHTFLDILETWKNKSALYLKKNLAQTINLGIWAFQGCYKGEWGKDRKADGPRQCRLPPQHWHEAGNSVLSGFSALRPQFPHLLPRWFPMHPATDFCLILLVDSKPEYCHRPVFYMTLQWGGLASFRNKEKIFHEWFQEILLETKNSLKVVSR